MLRRLTLLTCLVGLAAPTLAAPTPMEVEDLLGIQWVGTVSPSPQGDRVAFVVSRNDYASNKLDKHIYVVETGREGAPVRQLTNGEAGEDAPAWSPDGKLLAFVSSRGGSTPQIWLLPTDGGEARQLTSLSTGAWDPVWSPDSRYIAFTSSVFPDCTGPEADACNDKRLEARKDSKIEAQVFDHLLYRHWNDWRDGRRHHVFVVPVQGGAPRDVTPGPHDAPPLALGGERDYDFSPDGKTLAFVSNTDPVVATSTNNDVFEVTLSGGPAKPVRVSTSPGNDNSPRYSPDGRRLAWLSMERAGYESDRPRVLVRQGGKVSEWTKGYDGHPYSLDWARDGRSLFFIAPHHGYFEIYRVAADGVKQLSQKLSARKLRVGLDGKRLFFSHQAADRPPEVHVLDVDGDNGHPLTRLNAKLRDDHGLLPAEHHWYEGAGGARIHAVLVKPPGFDAKRRYPAMVMVHGGPQGMTGDAMHPRWNLQMFASRGYVVFGMNFHGSTGFGQAFTDSIQGDWGGKPYQDVMLGTEYLAKLPFVDGQRICAAGASYGGYMMNWVATHTKRFACIISHAGLYNLEAMYAATEELWFPERDMKGTPWTNRDLYREQSPHSYAENLHTPTLVIAGQRDYRVPVTQGLQMFTALQRQGIASRLLYFPDEDHFVQKPRNIELWWDTMHDWLARYLKDR